MTPIYDHKLVSWKYLTAEERSGRTGEERRAEATPSLSRGAGHAIATAHCVPILPSKNWSKDRVLPTANVYMPLQSVTITVFLDFSFHHEKFTCDI